ncbi:HAMP domain-containing protein [Pelobacter sp. M08fum]|uniref:HAMP domain-containing protein n=2 Tax=Pelovirga terrestris TaxID=2771352 RepID=A0A8J6QMB8_9BACT|nr:HAMP domain-containing protein [Pelovirga terrestris]
MYQIRGYVFTGEQRFLDAGRSNIARVRSELERAVTLADKSTDLAALKQDAVSAQKLVADYARMVDQAEGLQQRINANQQQMLSAASAFIENIEKYIAAQNQDLDRQVKNNDNAQVLLRRIKRINDGNEIIDLGNEIRRVAWQAQAQRNPQMVRDLQSDFTKLLGLIDPLLADTTQQHNREQLTGVRQAAANYQTATNNMLDNWLQNEALMAPLIETGTAVTIAAQNSIERGIDTTMEVANANAADLSQAERIMLIGIAIALLIGAVIAWFITRSITVPILRGVNLTQEIAKGDFSMRLNMDRQDEIGILANALDGMAENLSRNADVAEQIADGNLNVEVQLASEKDQLGLALQGMVLNLNDILGQIQVAGEQIASGSGQVADSSQALSQGATESASSLEEISASLNQLSSQTGTNAENANTANQLSTEARNAAEQGSQKMQEMVAAMTEINDAGQSISKIIKVIDEIAFQTNLLALNAAVEAARAGQHGKGFAVVAEEVRNLAARSAKAAAETSELIEGSVQKTANGTAIAGQTAEALQSIVSGIGKVTDLVAEIAAASSEQAQGVSQINQGITQIDQVTQQNTASAEESAAASEELSGQAAQMREMLMRFTLKHGSSAHSNVRAVPQKNAAAKKSGWGESAPAQPQKKIAAKQPIALDDDEFGKY